MDRSYNIGETVYSLIRPYEGDLYISKATVEGIRRDTFLDKGTNTVKVKVTYLLNNRNTWLPVEDVFSGPMEAAHSVAANLQKKFLEVVRQQEEAKNG